jgi:hypothetical protein
MWCSHDPIELPSVDFRPPATYARGALLREGANGVCEGPKDSSRTTLSERVALQPARHVYTLFGSAEGSANTGVDVKGCGISLS